MSNHYRHKLGTSFATQWVLEMGRRNKLVVVERARVPKATQVKLREGGFPTKNEDYKYYTRTAAASPSRGRLG